VQPANPASAGGGQAGLSALSELDDPASPLAKRSVYFPYDVFISTRIRPTARRACRLPHAQSEHPHHLEGNADERGSREYNLALARSALKPYSSR